jgi:hypothetical protein
MYSSPHQFKNRLLCFLLFGLLCGMTSSALADNPAYALKLKPVYDQLQGSNCFVDANLTSADTTRGLTGFDFTIAYDRAALNFREALPGNLIAECDWEFFSYQWGRNGDCHGDCPEGVVRIVGTASLSNSSSACTAPIPGVGSLPKTLFTLKFLVTSDRAFECSDAPVYWYWMDCRDNIISTSVLNHQVISQRVFNPGFPDSTTSYNVTDSMTGYPSYYGAQKGCAQQEFVTASRSADFYNCFVHIICPDSYDARGDININGLPYEIADYGLFHSYFLNGASVFTIDPPYQQATTDVNADGVTLTVGDLIYESLVIYGQAAPIPKPAATSSPWDVRLYPVGDTLYVETGHTVGALFLIFNGDVHPTLLQSGNGIDYLFDGTQTRMLILGDSDLTVGRVVSGPLLTFPHLIAPDSAQAADTTGMMLPVIIDSPTDVGDHQGNGLPAAFALENNYPNPFNPTTTISFSLPRSTSYTLTIYSMTGQEVASFTGTAGPGVVRREWDGSGSASGVYLYKLTAGTFSDTKKMMLVK